MALIKCYECGKKISDLAEFCPHYGAPNQTKEQEKTTYVSNLSLLWNRKLIRKIKWKSFFEDTFVFLMLYMFLIYLPIHEFSSPDSKLWEFKDDSAGLFLLVSFLSSYIYQIYKIKKNELTEKDIWKK